MESYLEKYESRTGGVILHTWTDAQGAKKEHVYIAGTPGAPIPSWFRGVLGRKGLADIAYFPHTPSRFYE